MTLEWIARGLVNLENFMIKFKKIAAHEKLKK
jgi:hypothetical protein